MRIHPSTRVRCVLSVALAMFAIAAAADPPSPPGDAPPSKTDKPVGLATFAGGCFWCMEPPFDKLDGVKSTTSGYIGGRVKDPTYKQVSSGRTGHAEAMQVEFDPDVVSYQQLLTLFWHNVDPTQAGGQFCDKGNQYRTAIFYHSEKQKELALKSKEQVRQELGKRIQTQIVKEKTFYPAEDDHQDYYIKNPTKYKFYRWKCGRDSQLDKVWGKIARQP